jgi:hypothetical protein
MNIMTKELRNQLGLPNPKPTPYTFQMADQTITKPIGLIKELKIHIHGIPHIVMYMIMKNNVLDFSYSMLLGRPWLCNAHVIHDWGNSLITIEGNGTMEPLMSPNIWIIIQNVPMFCCAMI